ncbi:DUF899 family protein [Saccharopolyspora pogona]|uniref:DUF899 family protein n=1 Tax=Saccharopolyspora pogona TaxID=333966 RepID=UPI001688EEBB|nr:DUF899 family protein [Saccharopolyspora pogona]
MNRWKRTGRTRCQRSSTGATWRAEIDRLVAREKAHTREGDAIAAARRRLPTSRGVEADVTFYHLLDLTPYGRQETWEDSPAGWAQP